MSDNKVKEMDFEKLLDEAAEAAERNISKKIPEPTEKHTFSPEHEQKMRELFAGEKKRAKLSRRRIILIAACVVLACAFVIAVGARRAKFLNFVNESDQANTDFNMRDDGGVIYSDDEVLLRYVPVEFEMIKNTSTKHTHRLKFVSGEKYFEFNMSSTEARLSIDTESGTAEEIAVNGYEAIYTTNSNINSVIWDDDETLFKVYGNIEKEELLKIAENVEKLK